MERGPGPEGTGAGEDPGWQLHEEAHPEPARLNPIALAKLRLVSDMDMLTSIKWVAKAAPESRDRRIPYGQNGWSLPVSGHNAERFRISRWESVLPPR